MNTPDQGITIMVVDDEPIFREIHKKQLKEFLANKIQYEIITACGSEDALEIAKKGSLDIVFTDICMDDRQDSGISLVKRIKAIDTRTRIIVVSNTSVEYLREKAIGAGASECFQLPLRPNDLETIFANHDMKALGRTGAR